MRRIFIGGNWKMQASAKKVDETISYLNSLEHSKHDRQIVVAPSYIFLQHVHEKLNKNYGVCAQNCSTHESGAFTGEISANMIKDIGLDWVILGHSERRTLFNEDDETIAIKITTALKCGLKVIACIGETFSQRKNNETEFLLRKQLESIINVVKDWTNIVIAYEPVWAIGTGVVATPEQAQSAHHFIRNLLKTDVSQTVSNEIRIIYGGSVKADNVHELLKMPDIDGFLVGGASLTKDFEAIISCKRS